MGNAVKRPFSPGVSNSRPTSALLVCLLLREMLKSFLKMTEYETDMSRENVRLRQSRLRLHYSSSAATCWTHTEDFLNTEVASNETTAVANSDVLVCFHSGRR